MLAGKTITGFKSWGKQLLITFKDFTIGVHMGLFGSYKINQPVKKNASLHLQFGDEQVNFSISHIKIIEEPLNEVYDWSADIMSKKWDAHQALEKLKAKPKLMICDALLDQQIFSGSGNIIKNESLFRARIHPESLCGKIPNDKLKELVHDTASFAADFLKWKKKGILDKNLQAYEQETCPRNHIPFHRKDTGKGKRKSYFCEKCQVRYD